MKSSVLDALQPISLDEVLLFAELQTRLDRKYILDTSIVEEVIGELTSALRRLEIDDRAEFNYETTYFDTEQLDSYRGSAFGRRRRFKVRTRAYLDSRTCCLEVKTVGGRGHTVKERIDHPFDLRHELTATAAGFIAAQGLSPDLVDRLAPTLITDYRRTTLADATGGRVTLDTGLACRTRGATAGIGDRVLLESKTQGAATMVDRLLWARGRRPVSVSKFGTGLAALNGELPANKWHRTLQNYFTIDRAADTASPT